LLFPGMEHVPPGGRTATGRRTRVQVGSDQGSDNGRAVRFHGYGARGGEKTVLPGPLPGGTSSSREAGLPHSRLLLTMPPSIFPIAQGGRILPVVIGLDGQEIVDLLTTGQPIPAPLEVRGLVDTATDLTAVGAAVLRPLAEERAYGIPRPR